VPVALTGSLIARAFFFQYQKCGTKDHGQIFLFNSIRDRALKRAQEVHSKSFHQMAEKEVKETRYSLLKLRKKKRDLFQAINQA
jgi:hypothetical protein